MYSVNAANNFELKELKQSDPKPKARSSASLIYYKSQLYLFGGNYGLSNGATSNDLWIYNIKTNKWKQILKNEDCDPNIRSVKRGNHRTVLYNNYMIIFGGVIKKKSPDNGLYTFNLDNYKWKRINTKGTPSKRSQSGMAIVNDYIFIYGGFANGKALNDCFMINVRDFIGNDNDTNITPMWISVNIELPCLRGYTMIGYKGHILEFGGYNKESNSPNPRNNKLKIWRNTESLTYRNSSKPSKIVIAWVYKNIEMKYGTIIPNDIYIVIQCFYGLIRDTYHIRCIEPRSGHSTSIININNKDYLFIFGGGKRSGYFNDGCLVDINS